MSSCCSSSLGTHPRDATTGCCDGYFPRKCHRVSSANAPHPPPLRRPRRPNPPHPPNPPHLPRPLVSASTVFTRTGHSLWRMPLDGKDSKDGKDGKDGTRPRTRPRTRTTVPCLPAPTPRGPPHVHRRGGSKHGRVHPVHPEDWLSCKGGRGGRVGEVDRTPPCRPPRPLRRRPLRRRRRRRRLVLRRMVRRVVRHGLRW